MKCEQARDLMHAYVDDQVQSKEIEKLNQHLDSCESCTVEFEEIKYLVQLMGEMDLKALPKGFEEELHEKLVLAAQDFEKPSWFDVIIKKLKTFKMKRMYYGFAAVPVMIMIVVLATRGFNPLKGSMDESAMDVMEYGMIEQETAAASLDGNGLRTAFTESIQPAAGASPEINAKSEDLSNLEDLNLEYREGRLIIQSANLRLDLEKYDDVIAQIHEMVNQTGGYIESESTSFKYYNSDEDNLKYGYLTLRVPAEGYGSIITSIKSLGLVVNESNNASDITKMYRDTAAEIENLKVTEARFREIMAQAVEIEDILNIENELTRLRGSISNYEKQIQDWEALVDMTTIYVELNEVKNLKPVVEPIDDSLIGKAIDGLIGTVNGIIRGLENMFIWIISVSPYLIALAIGGFIVGKLYKKRRLK